MSRIVLVAPATAARRADLRRAAEYRAGCRLDDAAVRAMLDDEWDQLVDRWATLGQWLAWVDGEAPKPIVVPALPPRVNPYGCGSRWRTDAQKAILSAAQKRSWVRRKALAAQKGA